MSTTSITQSIPSAQAAPTMDVSSGTNSPPSGTPTGTIGQGNRSSQKSDNISLSQGEAIGGAIGIAAAATMLGVGGTMLAKRNSQPKGSPQSQQGSQGTPETISRNVGSTAVTENRINGANLHEYLPTYPSSVHADAYPSPRQMTGERFHPAQSGSHCAVDLLNMLVNGFKPLRTTTSDYLAMMKGYTVDGTKSGRSISQNGQTPKNTVTDPNDFHDIYERNFEVAKGYLDRKTALLTATIKELSEKSNKTSEDLRSISLLKQACDKNAEFATELENIRKHAGSLRSTTFDPQADNAELERALKEFGGRAIGIAQYSKPRSGGTPQEIHDYKHHYYALEKQDNNTWASRDSSRQQLVTILDSTGKPVTNPYDAIKEIHNHLAANPNPSSDPKKPIHVFIPSPR